MTVAPSRLSANHWPGLHEVPSGPRTAISARVARGLFHQAVNRLDVTVSIPAWDVTWGKGGPEMVLHRPEEAHRLAKRTDEGGGTMTNAGHYLRSSRNLKRQMQYFEKSGIEVKDIATGLVDFPSLMNGRVVFLCWRMDEASITHWHELETGFTGRQPIED